MLSLKKNELAAALVCAAKGDIRRCLNGVLVEHCQNGDVHIVATDGHRLFCGKSSPSAKITGQGPWRLIIPRDAVAQAVKGSGDRVILEALPNGLYTLGNRVFGAIDGEFPDWRRLVMKDNLPEEPASFNWEYIADAQKSLRLWTDDKSRTVFVEQHGNAQPARITAEACDSAWVIVMSLLAIGEKASPFSPAEFEIVKEQETEESYDRPECDFSSPHYA